LATVKVVLPHPLNTGDASVPNTNVGKTITIASGVAISSGEFSTKKNVMDDLAAVTGLAITNLLSWKAAVGAITAVDVVMDPVVAAILAADANVTATVRVFRFAGCASALVVIPVVIVTVHSVLAGRIAVAAVNVRVAAARPLFIPAIENVVVAHPVDMVTPDGVLAIKNVGSTSAIVSDTSNGVFNLNVYEIEVGRSVYGSAIRSLLTDNNVMTVCVDSKIGVATMLATLTSFKVTAKVRVFKLAICALLAVVIPDAIVILHS